jgi:hypothetical protein
VRRDEQPEGDSGHERHQAQRCGEAGATEHASLFGRPA